MIPTQMTNSAKYPLVLAMTKWNSVSKVAIGGLLLTSCALRGVVSEMPLSDRLEPSEVARIICGVPNVEVVVGGDMEKEGLCIDVNAYVPIVALYVKGSPPKLILDSRGPFEPHPTPWRVRQYVMAHKQILAMVESLGGGVGVPHCYSIRIVGWPAIDD